MAIRVVVLAIARRWNWSPVGVEVPFNQLGVQRQMSRGSNQILEIRWPAWRLLRFESDIARKSELRRLIHSAALQFIDDPAGIDIPGMTPTKGDRSVFLNSVEAPDTANAAAPPACATLAAQLNAVA